MALLPHVRRALALLASTTIVGAAPAALGAQIVWTNWTSATIGTPGSAVGTMTFGGTTVTVNYVGEVNNNTQTTGGANHWQPASTWTGGAVTNAPPASDIIALAGGFGLTQTLTFSSPLLNPVFAVWSLGQPGVPRTYNFTAPFTIVAGGPNIEYGGSAVTMPSAMVLSGQEGNGTIMFTGTYSSISWTVPTQEYWHGFTVGAAGLGPASTVPEPSTYALVGSGLALLGAAVRRRRTA